MVDKRDDLTWVTLELTRQGELKALEGTLDAALRYDLGVDRDFPIFVPYLNGHKTTGRVSVLTEGYAFVASGLPETRYFNLESRSLVQKVLSTKSPQGLRVLRTIPHHRILDMKNQLRLLASSDVEEGMEVRVIGGCYSGLIGTVVDVHPEFVVLQIPLRSITILTKIQKSDLNLDPDQEPEAEIITESSLSELLSVSWDLGVQ